jgi:acetyl esterase/lipase
MRTAAPYWIILATLLTASGHSLADETPRRSMREIVMMPVVYRLPGMADVEVRSNLKYSKARDPNLLMDAYLPHGLGRGERRPAVLFIHGGAGSETTPKDWGIYTSWGRLVAASGLVGITFTHRLRYPAPMLSQASDDVEAAIRYARRNAVALHVDPDRIGLAAFSAGGPLLTLAMSERRDYIRCLVAFYAFLDIQQSDPHRAHESPEMVRRYSAVNYLETGARMIPPIFIARAGRDEIPTMTPRCRRNGV